MVYLGVIPYDWERKAGEGMSEFFTTVVPRADSAGVIGQAVVYQRQIGNHCFAPAIRHVFEFVRQLPNGDNELSKCQ